MAITCFPARAHTGSYSLSLVVGIVGLLAGVLLLVRAEFAISAWAPGLTRVTAPGKHILDLEKPGRYTIFYEYEGVVNGRMFSTGEPPPALQVALTAVATKAAIPLIGSSVPASPYSAAGASGIALMDFVIDRPGAYELSAAPSGDARMPEVILAVGHEAVSQNLSMWLQLLGGILLCVLSPVVAGIIALLTFLLRGEPKRSPQPQW